jgi:hypothetical protein
MLISGSLLPTVGRNLSLLQPADATSLLMGLTRQFKPLTSVDKNRERTLVQNP